MDKYIEYFTNYVNMNYDLSNNLTSLKYYHSMRVAWLMLIISQKLGLSEKDCLLAFKLGLCHDLGRFYEVVLEGKFDNLKFDHGTYSNKILYNDLFIKYMDVDEHLLFRKAIYNHNKKDLTNDLNYREFVFSNMLRDADKIDILGIGTNRKRISLVDKVSDNVLNNYYKNMTIDLKDIKTKSDRAILSLSFFKDLYFKASHDLIKDIGYLYEYMNFIKVNEENKDLFNSIITKINEERGKIYVR